MPSRYGQGLSPRRSPWPHLPRDQFENQRFLEARQFDARLRWCLRHSNSPLTGHEEIGCVGSCACINPGQFSTRSIPTAPAFMASSREQLCALWCSVAACPAPIVASGNRYDRSRTMVQGTYVRAALRLIASGRQARVFRGFVSSTSLLLDGDITAALSYRARAFAEGRLLGRRRPLPHPRHLRLNHRPNKIQLSAGFALPRRFQVEPLGDHSGRGEDAPDHVHAHDSGRLDPRPERR